MIDALLVDPELPASVVEALRRWAGSRAAVRLSAEDPDEGWLAELVRTSSEPLTLGGCRVDLRRGVVEREGGLVALTDTEALLLAWLATRAGTLVTRGELLQHVWGYRPEMVTRVVDVTIARLRSKIERDPANPELLVTVRGKGYRLDGLRAEPSPEVRGPAPPAPAPPDPELVGRDEDRARLLGWLGADDALVSVLGPPGIGKTALAASVSRAVPGARWCGLAAATNDQEALALIGAALDLPPSAREDAVRSALVHGERPLVVLDNAEHVLALVARLLREPPASPVLVTSRVRLGVPGERCLDLEPLPLAVAGRLFLALAQRLRSTFDADPDTLDAVAARCEGLPLALELAAAQVRVLSGPDLVRHLDRGGPGAGRVGHRTYDEALASSLGLLDAPSRSLLATLAALRGDVPLTLLEALVEEPLLDLGTLADASLVKIRHEHDGSVVHLLDTVRRYVARTLPLGDAERRSLAEGVAAYVDGLALQARTPPGWPAIRELGRIRPALWGAADDALALGAPAVAERLGIGLTHAIEAVGAEGPDVALLRRLAPTSTEVAWLLSLVASSHAELEEARRLADVVVAAAGDRRSRVRAAYALGMVGIREGATDTEALERALEEADDVFDRVRLSGAIALAHKGARRARQALVWSERALAHAERTGVEWLRAIAMIPLAMAYTNVRRHASAVEVVEQFCAIHEEAGSSRYQEMIIAMRLLAERCRGRFDRAIEVQLELIALMRAQGRPGTVSSLQIARADLLLACGRPGPAAEAARVASRGFRAMGKEAETWDAEVVEAEAVLAAGDPEGAWQRLVAGKGVRSTPDARWVAVAAALALDDLPRAEGAVDGATGPLAEVLSALIARARGQTPAPPDTSGLGVHLRLLAARLGGAATPAFTPRERAILGDRDPDPELAFPEDAVARLLPQ